MNLKALPGVFQMLPWGPRPDTAGHGGHCLPLPGALRFPLLTPGGSRLVVPACSRRGLRGETEGSGWVPLRTAALLGGLLGIFYPDIRSMLLPSHLSSRARVLDFCCHRQSRLDTAPRHWWWGGWGEEPACW